MQYIYYVTTPAKTTSDKPLLTNCVLGYGVLTDCLFILPKGCAGLVGIRFFYQSELVFPTNQNNWLTGDALAERFIVDVAMLGGQTFVQVATYNSDDQYDHTIELVFTVLPPSTLATVTESTGEGATIGGDGSEEGGGDISPLPTVKVLCPDGSYADTLDECPKVTPITPPVTTTLNIAEILLMF